jgi:hypothetical protein
MYKSDLDISKLLGYSGTSTILHRFAVEDRNDGTTLIIYD